MPTSQTRFYGTEPVLIAHAWAQIIHGSLGSPVSTKAEEAVRHSKPSRGMRSGLGAHAQISARPPPHYRARDPRLRAADGARSRHFGRDDRRGSCFTKLRFHAVGWSLESLESDLWLDHRECCLCYLGWIGTARPCAAVHTYPSGAVVGAQRVTMSPVLDRLESLSQIRAGR